MSGAAQSQPLIALVAGEMSGDLLGARLMRAIRAVCPDARFVGVGGPEMQALGFDSLFPMERLSVMGLFEAVGRFLTLLPARRRLARRLARAHPAVFVGIDAPDFNLALARYLRARGVPTAHYVCPSMWAWRAYRVKKVRRAVERVLTLFPFEADFCRRHGIEARAVGHPLASEIEPADPAAARRELGLAGDAPVVALLPGSRSREVRDIGAHFLDTARWLQERRPDIEFVAPMANPALHAEFGQMAEAAGVRVTLVEGRSRLVMSAADVVLLASGTATLEALLLRRPMVVAWRAMAATWWIMRRMMGRNIRFAALPNLLAGWRIVPEYLQDEARAERLGPAVLRRLEQGGLDVEARWEYERIARSLRAAPGDAAAAVLSLAGLNGDAPA